MIRWLRYRYFLKNLMTSLPVTVQDYMNFSYWPLPIRFSILFSVEYKWLFWMVSCLFSTDFSWHFCRYGIRFFIGHMGFTARLFVFDTRGLIRDSLPWKYPGIALLPLFRTLTDTFAIHVHRIFHWRLALLYAIPRISEGKGAIVMPKQSLRENPVSSWIP